MLMISRFESLDIFAGSGPHKPSEVRVRTLRSGSLVRVVKKDSMEKVLGRGGVLSLPIFEKKNDYNM
jgi:hypothetical protein